MIQLYNVYKSYNNTPALVDVSFIIKKGAFVFVTGPSGAGKSTLLKLIYRWESYDKGQVLVNGINVGKLKFNKLWQLRRHIGVVFQDYKLLPGKTILENVAFALEIVGAEKKPFAIEPGKLSRMWDSPIEKMPTPWNCQEVSSSV